MVTNYAKIHSSHVHHYFEKITVLKNYCQQNSMSKIFCALPKNLWTFSQLCQGSTETQILNQIKEIVTPTQRCQTGLLS